MTEYIFFGIIIVLLLILMVKNKTAGKNDNLQESIKLISENQKEIGKFQSENLSQIGMTIEKSIEASEKAQSGKLEMLEKRFETLEKTNEQKLENMRETMERRLSAIQKDNNEKMDSMRNVVDEKLQKTLDSKMTESFKLVNERLEQVYRGLGEMQNLASGVGDLKKVLSNVKTRGILGEIQLGAILEEILAPEQYETNFATIPGSSNVVEFAIKLPADDDKYIYLPIDSKFPADAYMKLQEAYETADPTQVKAAVSELTTRIKGFAKDIRDKYIQVPYTTEFAIMFLPFEGLYAEIVKHGLLEVLQRDYRVNVAGPSTMAALLNSLQMGFKTLAIQKRSADVWEILGAVKTEFDKFSDILTGTQKKLNQINSDLDKLIGTRTNVIMRKLRDVERLDEETTQKLLDE